MWSNPYIRNQNSMSVGTGKNFLPNFYDFNLFGPADDGFLFNLSKTDRLFQDVVGTTAVAVDADPIALALDGHSWGGNTLAQLIAGAAEICTGGDFSSATGWTLQSGVSISGGKLQLAVASTGLNYFTVPTQPAGFFRFEFTVEARSAGDCILRPLNSGAQVALSITSYVSTPKTQVVYAYASGSWNQVAIQTGGAGFTGVVDNVSVKAIPGNHGLQATTSARPFWKTPNFARLDGSDDNWLTGLVPGQEMTLAFKGKNSGTDRYAIGGSVGTNRFYLGMNGKMTAGVGSDSGAVIFGTTTVTNALVVGALTVTTSQVKLYVNGVAEYTGAKNGTIGSDPLRIGALNNGGTPSNWWTGDIYNALAINRALTPAEVLNLTNYWNAQ